MLNDGSEDEYILAVNKSGVNVLHLQTHVSILAILNSEI